MDISTDLEEGEGLHGNDVAVFRVNGENVWNRVGHLVDEEGEDEGEQEVMDVEWQDEGEEDGEGVSEGVTDGCAGATRVVNRKRTFFFSSGKIL